MKRLKSIFLISLLTLLLGIFNILMISDVVEAGQTYEQVLKKYTNVNSGFKKATTTEISNEIGGVKYVYRFGRTNTGPKPISTIFYFDQNNNRVKTLYGNGDGGYFQVLGENGVLNATTTGGTVYENLETKTIVYLSQPSKDTFIEMIMKPAEFSDTIQTDINVWNDSSSDMNLGVVYSHDTALGYESGTSDDGVPVYAMGRGRGMFTEVGTFRLNYTMERYPSKENKKINFAAPPYQEYTNVLFAYGNNVYGSGKGDDAPFDKTQPLYVSSMYPKYTRADSTVSMKVSPQKVASGKNNSLTFYTGVEEGTSGPLIYSDENEYIIPERTPQHTFSGDWYEFNNSSGTIHAELRNSNNQVVATGSQSTNTSGEGRFNFKFNTSSLPADNYRFEAKIKTNENPPKESSRAATAGLRIQPLIKFEAFNKVTNKKITVDSLGEQAGELGVNYSQQVPKILNSQFILDKNTPGLKQDGVTVEGVFTELEETNKSVKVFYYPAPTFTLTANSVEINEVTVSTKISGTWVDETKSGGTLTVMKGTEKIGTVTYPPGNRTGDWESIIPKEKLNIGSNQISVGLEHGYSEFKSSQKQMVINRKKHVKVNYYLNKGNGEKELLPANLTSELPQFYDEKVGETITLVVPQHLEGQKYKFNPIASGINSGVTITKEVTSTLNELNVVYDLNEMPVEIRYLNDTTGQPILANLTSKNRKSTKQLGQKVVGISIASLILAEDKKAEGYQENPTIKAYKEGSPTVELTNVADGPTIIEIRFQPKFEIKPPKTMSFGEHKLSIFGDTKELEQEAKLEITNTFETGESIKAWEVTGTFTGFETGTEATGKTALQGQLKYDNQTMQGAAPVIKSVTHPDKAYDEIGLKNKLKLEVYGSGAILGDYQGTITWTLSDAL
ncbi:hypothetical protein [Vagococcus sp.]|uniref:hypothetical protein n=1 Tax=Vagococcus sp. TaxID=1933889 RepID=UPI003F9B9DA2